jgi:hypothetical protein
MATPDSRTAVNGADHLRGGGHVAYAAAAARVA